MGTVQIDGSTPKITVGNATAEDATILFDGNAQDFYIALDDSADDLVIGLGSTIGTTPIISLTEAGAVTMKNVGTGDDNPMVLTLQTSETDMAADDVIGKISFQAPDEGTGTDAVLVSGAIQAVAEGDHSSSSNATRLEFMTGASEAATTKMSVSSGGDVKFNSGFGSVTTVFGCRAWANINQTSTQAIKGSGGVSSITDTGVGATDVNFSTNMPDGNYCTSMSPGGSLLSTANQQFPVAIGNDDREAVDKGVIFSRQCDNDGDTFAAADSAQISIAFFR